VEFVRPIAEQAGVSLSFNYGDEDLTIRGNEDGIRQIILNLICNAIRHTPAHGKITVSIRGVMRAGKMRALVDITDTGCGIPADFVGQLFNAGFSVSGDTPGLGLAVSKRLMIQHGGEIHLSSRVNCGSTFQLEFPVS
jgi:signal transduction histidine kinase